ncbi:SAM-dependent methyltransferase [Streptomyces sp. MMBL 11-1]|uniref:SAM-dependent methyltransferase n=1 Tax=Streptomyces sp. MMBL 11-1 TaxID=3026420 RepID=UPI00235DF2B8|nr:SAM-dependent methyltransferase [Streptomyces sp. MMBL 11-1]
MKDLSRACALRHDRAVFHGVLPLLRTPAVEALDRQRPIGILIDNSGPWASSFADLQFTLNTLRGWLPPGSAIALTHTTDDATTLPRQHAQARGHRAAADLAAASSCSSRPLTRTQIRSLIEPWPLTEHGLLPTSAFLAQPSSSGPSARRKCGSYAAISLHAEAT